MRSKPYPSFWRLCFTFSWSNLRKCCLAVLVAPSCSVPGSRAWISDQGEHLGCFGGNSRRNKEQGMDLADPGLPKLGPACVQPCAQLGSARLHCCSMCFPQLVSPEICAGFCLSLRIASQVCFVQCFTCILLPTIIYTSVKLSGNVVEIFSWVLPYGSIFNQKMSRFFWVFPDIFYSVFLN